jgi:hypothetical protein
MDDDDRHDASPPQRDNLAVVLQIVQLLLIIAGAMWMVMGRFGQGEITAGSVSTLSTQLDNFKMENTRKLDALQAAISKIPDLSAATAQQDRRLDQTDRNIATIGAQASSAERVGIQNSADIVNILRIIGARK